MCLVSDLSGARQIDMQFWTTPQVTEKLDPVTIPDSLVRDYGPFADDYNSEKEIHGLIGSDLYWSIMQSLVAKVNKLVVIETLFGRIVTGNAPTNAAMATTFRTHFIRERELQEMWSLEAVGVKASDLEDPSDLPKPKRVADGRLEVKLPWKNDLRPYGNALIARARLKNEIRKMTPDQLKEYEAYGKQWESDGVIRSLENAVRCEDYYLPHRGVWNKNKLRVVVDGSARGKDGRSINEHLHTGPNLIPKIPEILTAFRLWEYPVNNDIQKAFLQVRVNEEDQQYLRTIWIEDGQEIVRQFARLPFGLNSSPWLLQASLEHLFDDKLAGPEWVRTQLKQSFYVDDLVTSLRTPEEKRSFKLETQRLMNTAGFQLKEWEVSEKILGMGYDIHADRLSVRVETTEIPDVITKRTALSLVHGFFDPIGILSPWMVQGRLICRDTWKAKGGWDSRLEPDLEDKMKQWLMVNCRKVEIPRWVEMSTDKSLHIFVDASESAYAAVAYLVGSGRSFLLMSRFRVAPLKPKLSIPRLELMAALIGSRMYQVLINVNGLKDCKVFFWTDSEVVRHWVSMGPEVLKVFESNRVREIIEKSTRFWRRVPTDKNPADLARRGVGLNMVTSDFWLCGPQFLVEEECQWPVTPKTTESQEARIAFKTFLIVDAPEWEPSTETYLVDLSIGFKRATRILALVMMFIENCRRRRIGEDLMTAEVIPTVLLRRAKHHCLRVAQRKEFPEDFRRLSSGLRVLNSSRMSRIRPSFGEDRLIMGHPRNCVDPNYCLPVLAVKSNVFKPLVMETHRKMFHGGVDVVLTELKRRYIVIKGRTTVKRILKNACYNCKRMQGRPFRSREGRLPDFRITPCRPFKHTGMDFMGPFKTPGKRYVLLFTCAVTRAVHLEVTNGMSFAEVQRAVRRFAARRGQPSVIYCDNAPQFIQLTSVMDNTNLKLIPPHSPWYGGFYERLVGCVKRALKTTFLNSRLVDDELRTVITEIEEAINRRPLCMTEDDEVLTPACFLYGRPPNGDDDDLASSAVPSCSSMWKRMCSYSERCWKKFESEYLLTLQNWRRTDFEGEAPRVGEIVLIRGEGSRRNWTRGRVLQLLSDQTAELMIRGRTVRRAVSHLYRLETDVDDMPILEAENVAVGDNDNEENEMPVLVAEE